MNFLESLSLAKDYIEDLEPVYQKIMAQVFEYSKKDKKHVVRSYPFNIEYGKKDYISDYIMKTPKEKLHPKAKKKDPNNHYITAILASNNFTEEEQSLVLNKLNNYESIQKDKRDYYEDTYEEHLNHLYFNTTYMMIDYLKDEYSTINTKKLYHLTAEEQRTILIEVLDENKIKNRYWPYYYADPIYIKHETPKEKLKEQYIQNFLDLTSFLKEQEKIQPFSITSGIIYKDESHFNKKRHETSTKESEEEELFKKEVPKSKKKRKVFSYLKSRN